MATGTVREQRAAPCHLSPEAIGAVLSGGVRPSARHFMRRLPGYTA